MGKTATTFQVHLFGVLLFGLVLISGGFSAAADTSGSRPQLVMFESAACTYCEIWHEEIGSILPKTSEAEQVDLRLVDINDDRPDDLAHIKGVVYTPTFVLMDDGEEIGRIIGYAGDHFFWWMLDELIGKLETPKS